MAVGRKPNESFVRDIEAGVALGGMPLLSRSKIVSLARQYIEAFPMEHVCGPVVAEGRIARDGEERGVDGERPSLVGACGTAHDKGDCDRDRRGFWTLSRGQVETWLTARDTCMQKCRSCDRCHFISYSLKHRDCSCFSSCNMANLNHDVRGFRSRSLSNASISHLAEHDSRHIDVYGHPSVSR